MIHSTPFGELSLTQPKPNQLEAVQRALAWCQKIAEATLWTHHSNGTSVSLQRTIHGQTIEIFPLEAARIDLGIKTRFSKNHLPIHLNNADACVRSKRSKTKPLHTDMVASMVLLLGSKTFELRAVPKTLHAILTPEQRAVLPPAHRRERNVPGQPSTSGRAFLPEAHVLDMFNQNPNETVRVQFEKRNGDLRNMLARDGILNRTDGGQSNTNADAGLPYNPSDYHLKTVHDIERGEYRNIATDRVTMIAVGERSLRTVSAQTRTGSDAVPGDPSNS